VTITPEATGAPDPRAPAESKPPRVGLLPLIAAFGTIGLTSFGGARASYFRHVLVVSRGWLDDAQFLEGLTISQTLPGPNVSNLSVYTGNRLRGPLGALVALLAFLVPGSIMIVLLAAFGFGHENLPAVRAVFLGVGAAAVGLSVATTLQIGVRGVRGVRDWIIVAVTFAAIAFLRLPILIPLLVIAPISVWLWRPRRSALDATQSAMAAKESEGISERGPAGGC
jgi:chromate transporter